MSDTRERIAAHVREHPGVHFSALARRLELASGQVQYHLRRLDLVAESVAGRTHYFPPEYDAWERRALALLRRETAGDVVAHLLVAGESRPAAVADALDIARSTLEWHLDHLLDADLVEKRRDADGRVTLRPARPEATADLLGEADPALARRLVDRFARLLDDLLAGD